MKCEINIFVRYFDQESRMMKSPEIIAQVLVLTRFRITQVFV
jgi:hypothetical protein